MPKHEREERHLARQRGAGKPGMTVPSFGFDFKTVAQRTLAGRAAASKPRSPIKKTPVRRRKSIIYKTAAQKTPPSAERAPTLQIVKTRTPKSSAPRSAKKRISSIHQPLPPPPPQDDLPEPVRSPIRKAKFYEHLSEDEPAAPSRLKKPKKTTKRKRKGITMPRPGKTKVKKTTSQEPPEAIPADPADIVQDSEPEQEMRTDRGSVKRRRPGPSREIDQDHEAKRVKLHKPRQDQLPTPRPSSEAQKEPQQLPSPVGSGQSNVDSPPKTTMQKWGRAAAKMLGRQKSSSTLSKTSTRTSDKDGRLSTKTISVGSRLLSKTHHDRTLMQPPPNRVHNPARMKTAPPDELTKEEQIQRHKPGTPSSLEEPAINRQVVKTTPTKAEDAPEAARLEEDGEFMFRRGGRRKL
ncbi:hypothetical protein KVT40_006955 [Elsinoe batatas]|uniref:Uncharacterized protein n=1 Tax=Elsinoe batatas TaxID=2601811 RepID=A0A8K0KWH2_9PEZI|nr:hypothetical protein KVT40_006955 [Elsinoe batatas]